MHEMNEHILAVIKDAVKQGKLFYYSATPDGHDSVDICLVCDAVLVPERFRDELSANNL